MDTTVFTHASDFRNFIEDNFAPIIAKNAGKLFVEYQTKKCYYDREIASLIVRCFECEFTIQETREYLDENLSVR